jgi:hypothetical protein
MNHSAHYCSWLFLFSFSNVYNATARILIPAGTFEIGLPNYESRLQILNLFLEKHSLADDARKMIPVIARRTPGYSGSDLKELW